jgi:hypothetical protein
MDRLARDVRLPPSSCFASLLTTSNSSSSSETDTPSVIHSQSLDRLVCAACSEAVSPGTLKNTAPATVSNTLLLPDFPAIPCLHTLSFIPNEFVYLFFDFSEPGDACKQSAGHSLDDTLHPPTFPPSRTLAHLPWH